MSSSKRNSDEDIKKDEPAKKEDEKSKMEWTEPQSEALSEVKSTGNVPQRNLSASYNDVNKPGTSDPGNKTVQEQYDIPHETRHRHKKKWYQFLYDSENKTVCDRTKDSWTRILAYSVVYLMFLSTYTMVLLLVTQMIFIHYSVYLNMEMDETLETERFLDVTMVPEMKLPLIWYRNGEWREYQKYVEAIEHTLNEHTSRTKRAVQLIRDLGPCGEYPYGYGDQPCVLIRINNAGWSVRPLEVSSLRASEAPEKIQKLLGLKQQKLWLNCDGYNAWDRQHLGVVNYYPDPPGFDNVWYPVNISNPSPLVAVKFSNFSQGVALTIECQLWYAYNTSSTKFCLYVAKSK